MKAEKNTVLVIVAHPDDEVLGCGGSMAKHVSSGDNVFVLIMSDGVTSRAGKGQQDHAQLEQRTNAAKLAAETLGARLLATLDYPDNRMDAVDLLDVVKSIESQLEVVKPTIVYTHHASDVNIDHRIVHDAVIAACRPQPGVSIKKLLFFEVPSSTEWRPGSSRKSFSPDYFVDISATVEKKFQALNCYEKEMREFPHARSLKACQFLVGWRGATIGVQAAEAFEVGRIIA